MNINVYLSVTLLFCYFIAASQNDYAIVIHDGAGVMLKSEMNEERRSAYTEKLNEALEKEIEKPGEMGGTGGVIAVYPGGNIAMEFNTSGMYRGFIKSSGGKEVLIFKNE